MKIDFEKYGILRLVQTSIINPVQQRAMGNDLLWQVTTKTAEALRRELIKRFIKVRQVPNDDIVEVKGDCFVVEYEDLLRMVKDAYAAGLRSKEYWGRFESPTVLPTMED